jgi:hypothetical protein
MSLQKYNRTVIHFFHLLDVLDEDILAPLDSTYREGGINLKTAQRWSSKFPNGETDFGNEPMPGRRRQNEKLPVIGTMIEENPYLSQKKIAQILPPCYDIVKRLITKDLNLHHVNFKSVPQALTVSRKLERVKISRKLFGQLNRL